VPVASVVAEPTKHDPVLCDSDHLFEIREAGSLRLGNTVQADVWGNVFKQLILVKMTRQVQCRKHWCFHLAAALPKTS